MEEDYASVTMDMISMLEYLDSPDSFAKVIKLSNSLIERLGRLLGRAEEWAGRYGGLQPGDLPGVLADLQSRIAAKE